MMSSLKAIASYWPLFLYSLGMVIGQLLLKQASISMKSESIANGLPGVGFLGLLQVPVFYVAIAWYAALTLAWVWLLTLYPLSRAYPWVALALVITPLFGVWLYGEPFTWRLIFGLVIISAGVLVIADGKS